MSERKRWSRRKFLIGSGAVGGALVLGFVIVPKVRERRARRAMLELAEKSGDFAPNAWLTIRADGAIVFTLDRVEMGQGTYTSHPMLIAEELEVDPAKIQVEFAVADRRYDHPEFNLQMTGGSTSVRTSWERLAIAGATAREMLRAAAAQEWGVPIGECAAEQGNIVHRPSGRAKSYGSLTKIAAALPIPDVLPKKPGDYRVIGKHLDRLDAPLKVTGKATFGIDVVLPGMLTAVVVRPPVLGARVKRFDAAKAMQRPGVKDVFEVPSGVAIVADSYWTARKTAQSLDVEWEGGREQLSSEAIGAELEALTKQPGDTVRNDGDAEKALGNSKHIVEASYEAPHLAHAPMEPQNCTAHVHDGICEIWAPTQAPGVAREQVAAALDLDREKVIVRTTFLGGGFGRRLVQDFVVEAAEVARKLDKPVKVLWSREDDMGHSIYRPHVHHALRGALDESGKPVAWRHRIAAPSLLQSVLPSWVPAMTPDLVPRAVDRALGKLGGTVFAKQWVDDETSTEGARDVAYGIANLRVELAQHDPGVPIGFWRSVGHSHTAFAVESFIDEMAAAAKADPYEFRRSLLKNAPRALGVLELAAKTAGWGSPLAPGHFRGIAQHRSFLTYVSEVAEVSVQDGQLRVHRIVCAVDCGRVVNPDIVRAQMESGIVFGLSAALKQRITYKGGKVEQSNFHDYRVLRMREMPRIDVVIVDSAEPPTGVGEPGVPPVAPAVANAIAAATGQRPRKLPFLDGAMTTG
jgi:CO/xanthine dehydrogenase Mo-binding subunit